MNLYVLQHGEAEDKQTNPDRPLTARGERDIRVLAMHMRNMGVHLEKIFHSGKLRAEQSASLVAEVLSPDIRPVQAAGLNPNDEPAVIVSDIDRIGENILIASHMPFVSRLCSVLLTGTTGAEFACLPGTLLCLEQSEGKWRLAYMLRPDFL